MSEANSRLTDDEHQVAELTSAKVKLQKEFEAANAQLEEIESRCSAAERAKATLESQLAETQVKKKTTTIALPKLQLVETAGT